MKRQVQVPLYPGEPGLGPPWDPSVSVPFVLCPPVTEQTLQASSKVDQQVLGLSGSASQGTAVGFCQMPPSPV